VAAYVTVNTTMLSGRNYTTSRDVTRAVVDKCRHCGDLAFQPIQAKQPEALRGRWFARRLWRRQLPMNKNPRRSRQTGRFTSVPTHD
jgi:hypothetical protein